VWSKAAVRASSYGPPLFTCLPLVLLWGGGRTQSEMKRASCRRWASRKTIPTQRSTSLPCPKTSTRAIASSKRLPECTRSRSPPRRGYASSTRPALTLRTRFPCYAQSQLPVWSGGVCPHRTARPRQEFPYRSPLRSHRHTRAIGSGTASSFTPSGVLPLVGQAADGGALGRSHQEACSLPVCEQHRHLARCQAH